ncbi:MAG: CRISPR-associated protein Cas2 [bacterium]|jgi:CRISPR-associated protein Cas2
MVVFQVENAPQRLRGTLTAWCLQVRAGLYVGKLSVRTQNEIWAMITGIRTKEFSAVLLYSSKNEQGFSIRTFGKNRRNVVNMDGLELVEYMPDFSSKIKT